MLNDKEFLIKNYYNIFIVLLNSFLLVFNVILIYEINKNKIIYNIKYNLNNNTDYYSLYHLYKYSQISILIPSIEELKFERNFSIFKLMNSLVSQTLKEIQICLSLSEKENYYYDIIRNITKYDKRVKIYITNEKDLMNNIFFLLEKTKGKFIIILNNFVLLNYDELERFYNFTKGKTNHIFKFISNNGNDIHLIKSKILKDIQEEEFKFVNIKDMINYIYLLSNPYLNYISIVFCPNNFYTTYVYVGMISILNSKYYFTFISFYLIISEDYSFHSYISVIEGTY